VVVGRGFDLGQEHGRLPHFQAIQAATCPSVSDANPCILPPPPTSPTTRGQNDDRATGRWTTWSVATASEPTRSTARICVCNVKPIRLSQFDFVSNTGNGMIATFQGDGSQFGQLQLWPASLLGSLLIAMCSGKHSIFSKSAKWLRQTKTANRSLITTRLAVSVPVPKASSSGATMASSAYSHQHSRC
jgi:hypothetical protein